MVAELAISAWMAYQSGVSLAWSVPLLLVLCIWVLTVFRAIPLHDALARERDDAVIEALIRVNWPRTLLWTVKAIWVSFLFLQLHRSS